MQIAQFDNLALNWQQDGNPEGRPVVFANSLGTDFRLWDAVLPLLPTSLRYIRMDKRGHGLSSVPDGPYSIDDLAGDVAQLLDRLEVQDVFFVGLSIGGLIAQKLAYTRPDLCHSMVLSNTAAKIGTPDLWNTRIDAINEGGIEVISEPTMERWFAPEFRATPDCLAWKHMLERTHTQGYVSCCAAIANADLREETASLTLPTYGICGSDDGATPPELTKSTLDLIAGSQFHIIDGTGHLPCVEKPQDYAALITKFLKESGFV